MLLVPLLWFLTTVTVLLLPQLQISNFGNRIRLPYQIKSNQMKSFYLSSNGVQPNIYRIAHNHRMISNPVQLLDEETAKITWRGAVTWRGDYHPMDHHFRKLKSNVIHQLWKPKKCKLSNFTDDRFGFQSQISTLWLSKTNYLSRLAIRLGLGWVKSRISDCWNKLLKQAADHRASEASV